MSGKFNLSVEESLKKMGKTFEDLESSVEAELNDAIRDIAHATHAQIVASAQTGLSSTRQDYLKGLDFVDLGDNAYLISIKGTWPNMLESGFPAYNQTDVLLESKKQVSVGSRSGQPWVQTSKEGSKFAHVPFERKPFSKESQHAELAESIKAMTATNMRGRQQKITSVFKDLEGNPLEGKVAMARSKNPMLDQLVKYQKTYVNETTNKRTTQSIYMNFRTVSEAGDPWIHPGFAGLHALEEAERYAMEQLDRIVKTVLGGR